MIRRETLSVVHVIPYKSTSLKKRLSEKERILSQFQGKKEIVELENAIMIEQKEYIYC